MRALARVLRYEPGIERMKRQFDERIALATIKGAIVALAHRLRERFDGRPQRRATDRVQLPADKNRTVFRDGELKTALLDGDALIMGDAFRVEGMTQSQAVVPEPTSRRFPGVLEDVILIVDGCWRCWSRFRESAGGARNYGKMRETNLAGNQSILALRQ